MDPEPDPECECSSRPRPNAPEVFFPEVRQITLPSISGALVVGIFPLLQFRRDHAIVIGASKKARIRKLMLFKQDEFGPGFSTFDMPTNSKHSKEFNPL